MSLILDRAGNGKRALAVELPSHSVGLRLARIRAGLSLSDASYRAAGIGWRLSPGVLSKWERGVMPGADTWFRICDLYGVDPRATLAGQP